MHFGISDKLSELNRPDESVSSYQELTDEEVKKIGAACNTQGIMMWIWKRQPVSVARMLSIRWDIPGYVSV